MEEGTIVENWLRTLDLVYYTQAFVDNGYDDLEICKQIGEDDLNAIGVVDEADRDLVLRAVQTLKEHGGTAVYFTLEETPGTYEDYALVGGNMVPPQDGLEEEGAQEEEEEGEKKKVEERDNPEGCNNDHEVQQENTNDDGSLAPGVTGKSEPVSSEDTCPLIHEQSDPILTSQGSSVSDAYGQGKLALTTYPRLLQLSALTSDTLEHEGIALTNTTPVNEDNQGWNTYAGMVSAYGHTNRSVPPPLPPCPPPDSIYADIGPGSITKDSERTTTIRAPGNDDYTELIESEINNQKKGSGITRFIKNVIGMTSGMTTGKKYTYRKHDGDRSVPISSSLSGVTSSLSGVMNQSVNPQEEPQGGGVKVLSTLSPRPWRRQPGDLSASEITMADEERIELMLMVKEGKISMHDAVERVKAYERQARTFEKSSPERDGERRHSPQLPSLLRRKSSDSRGSGGDGRSQESPHSRRSSSSTESSPSQRSRSGSRSRSRTGFQTLVDFCPEEQLIVELSHPPEGSYCSSSLGGSNISISVKAVESSQAISTHNHRQHKHSKDDGSPSTHSPEQSGGTVLCASPMRWMSPKRSRKYISSNLERSLPQPPQDAKQETQLESQKHKKGSPGNEQKQRSFLKSPFSRRKRSGSSSSTSGSAKEQSPKQKPKEQQPSPVAKQLEGQHFFPTQSYGSFYQGHQPQVRSQGRIYPDNIDIGSRVPVVGAETVYQHSNLLYRKGSTSSSSSSSIQSPRDPRLLEAARFGAKREKSPSPSPGSGPGIPAQGGGTTPTTQQKALVKNGNGHVGTSVSSTTAAAGAGKANSRIPSYYTNPKRRSLNLSDGPDICSDSSSEGGRTRRTNSDAKRSNGTPRSSVSRTKADSRTSSTESLRKYSSSDSLKKHAEQRGTSSPQPKKTRQPSKLSLEGGLRSPRTSDSETRSLSRGSSQVPRSASGSRLPVNFRSSITSPPRSPRSPGSSSQQSTTGPSEIQKKRRSDGSRVSRTSISGEESQCGVKSSTKKRLSQSSSKESQRTVIPKASREKESRGGKDLDKRDSLSALSVGSDTSTTSVESRTLREPSEKRTTKIPRSTSGSTTNDESLASDLDDQDMGDQNSEMFVRNSATRSSLSERMKGLGRDVKKKISRLKPSRNSRDADDILDGSCDDGAKIPDESKSNSLGSHAMSGNSGHSSLSQDDPDLYKGPFVGKAKVIRDYTPSPYDREALTLKQGDIINIISMNETGMWRGMVGKRIGTFKFINVEILPAESPQPSPIKRQPRIRGPRRPRPRTVQELLQRLGLQHLTTVFLLHGYHTLELFSELEEEDLDELCILQPEERAKIVTAAQLLVDYDNTDSPESGTGSRPQTPGPMALTPSGSTLTLTEPQATADCPGNDGTSSPLTHGAGVNQSALRTKLQNEATSQIQSLMDARDSGCYASSETLQHTELASRISSENSKLLPKRSCENSSQDTSDQSTAGTSSETQQTSEPDSKKEPAAVDETVPNSEAMIENSDDNGNVTSQTTQVVVSEASQDSNVKNTEHSTSDVECQSPRSRHSSSDSTTTGSPNIRIKPRVPIRKISTSSTPVNGDIDEEDGELSPLRRPRPSGHAQRISSHTSQTTSPCGSPTHFISPIGSPHQIRSHSLPGSPLRSHSPNLLSHLPPRSQSPIFQRQSSHRHSTPNIQSIKQRLLRPKIPERTSSLTFQTLSSSTDSINSSTQTPQVIYAENGIQPTLPNRLGKQNGGYLHLRRSSSPAIRTFMSSTPPGSPQKTKLPMAHPAASSGSLPARLITRHESLIGRPKERVVSTTLETLVVAKLEDDGIDLTQPPYTDSSGFCGIPPALVQRYAEELRREISEIASAIDECRTRQVHNNGRVAVPNDFLVDSCSAPSFDIATTTVPDFLTSVGMPMYLENLVNHSLQTIDQVKDMKEADWRSIGVNDPRHLRRLSQSTELLRARIMHADKQKQLRIAKLSQIRDKV